MHNFLDLGAGLKVYVCCAIFSLNPRLSSLIVKWISPFFAPIVSNLSTEVKLFSVFHFVLMTLPSYPTSALLASPAVSFFTISCTLHIINNETDNEQCVKWLWLLVPFWRRRYFATRKLFRAQLERHPHRIVFIMIMMMFKTWGLSRGWQKALAQKKD